MCSLPQYVCSRQAQSANCRKKKTSKGKQWKKAMLEITIKEFEKDTDKYAINAEKVGEVEEMKT